MKPSAVTPEVYTWKCMSMSVFPRTRYREKQRIAG